MAEPKYKQFVTVLCVASYPKLLVPDTKYKKAGEFSVKLIMSPEEAEKINAQATEALTPFKESDLKDMAERAKKTPKLKASLKVREEGGFGVSIADQIGEDGEPTGQKVVTFKQAARITFMKDGKEVIVNKIIPLFDAKGKKIVTHDSGGNLLPNAIKIWGGSKLKVAYNVIPGWNEATKSYWATLRPVAVQVIELSQGQARDASDYGFGAEEGFEAESEPTMPTGDEQPQQTEGEGTSATTPGDGNY